MIASYTCVPLEPLPFTSLAQAADGDSSAYHRHEDRSFTNPGAQFATCNFQQQMEHQRLEGNDPGPSSSAAAAGTVAGFVGGRSDGGAGSQLPIGVFRPTQMSQAALAMRCVCKLWCEVLSESVRRILLYDRQQVTLWASHFPNVTHLALGNCNDILIRSPGCAAAAGPGPSGSAAGASGRPRRTSRNAAALPGKRCGSASVAAGPSNPTAGAAAGSAVRSLAPLSSLRNLQVNDTTAHLHLASTCSQLAELVVCSNAAQSQFGTYPGRGSSMLPYAPFGNAFGMPPPPATARRHYGWRRIGGGGAAAVRAPAVSRRSALDLTLASLPGLQMLRLSGIDASAARLGNTLMSLSCLTSLRLHQCDLPTFLGPATGRGRGAQNLFGRELVLNLGAKLQDLSLQGCGLRMLPPEVLLGLSRLRMLDLSANWLVALPATITCLTQLEYLDLQHNNLLELPAGMGALARLADLDLSMNQLHSLPQDFSELRGLTHLHLGGMHQLNMRSAVTLLGALTNLHSLGLFDTDLSADGLWPPLDVPEGAQRPGGPLEDLVSALGPAGRLRELVMDGCGLETLPANFSQLSALSHLSVMENFDATGLPESLMSLRGLAVLRLGYLDLSTPLPPGLFDGLPELRELDLEQNFLPCISTDISKLTNLQVLNLIDAVDVDATPDAIPWTSIYRLTRLRQLAVSGPEDPERPPPGIGALARLEVLQLRGLPLPGYLMNEICSGLHQLSSLECTQAELTALPASVTRLARLTDLQLASNRLTKLPNGFGALTRLTELMLRDNPSLRALPKDITLLTRLHSLSWSVSVTNTLEPTKEQLAWMAQLPDLLLVGSCKFSEIAKVHNISWTERARGPWTLV